MKEKVVNNELAALSCALIVSGPFMLQKEHINYYKVVQFYDKEKPAHYTKYFSFCDPKTDLEQHKVDKKCQNFFFGRTVFLRSAAVCALYLFLSLM